MSRVKVSMMVLFAVAAFSALATASASAGWFVGGTALPEGSKLALTNTATVDSEATLNIPKAKIQIKCSGLDGEDALIIGTEKGLAKSLIFTGCKVTEPTTGCTLEDPEVPTVPVNALVTLGTKESDIVTFTPETKTEFAKIPFASGNTCAFNEGESVKGSVKVIAPTGQLELLSQAIEGLGSVENNSLEVANDKSFIEGGKALLRLASDALWSFK